MDADGVPVRGVQDVAFLDKSGGGRITGPAENDNHFGMSGLTPNATFRIETSAAGFDPYRGEFSLKPGELRFVKVVMKRATPGQNSAE